MVRVGRVRREGRLGGNDWMIFPMPVRDGFTFDLFIIIRDWENMMAFEYITIIEQTNNFTHCKQTKKKKIAIEKKIIETNYSENKLLRFKKLYLVEIRPRGVFSAFF